ncbi:MAG: ShlB/FhaC/HecB family hemolysin secretion/activation protein [Janthinobacterium lividum]
MSLAVVGAHEAAAQVLPNAGQLLNEQQRTPPLAPPSAPVPATTGVPSVNPGADVADGLVVQLRSVRFSGDTATASSENLASLAAPSIGRTVGHSELLQIAEAMSRELRGRGYLLARAYLPRQDLTDGNLEIAVSAGRLQSGADRIVVRGTTRVASSRILAIAEAALPAGRPLRAEDLERAVLLVNDLPGVTARSTLERGSEPGTSRLVIEAAEGPQVQGSAWTDNFGNRSTGAARVGAQVQLDDPLGIGDQAGFGVTKSTGSTIANLNYSVPLTPSGLRLNAGASYLRYHVDQDAFRALDLRGDATTAQLGLSYPLLRTRERNLTASATYEHRQLKDEVLGLQVRSRKVDSVTFGLNGNRVDAFGSGGVMEGGLALEAGRTNLSGNADDRFFDRLTARTQGGFEKLALRASRLQNLGGAPGSEWTLFAGASGQLASSNLDSSEKFILGGPSGVRAYAVGEAAGDQGVIGTLELRRNVDVGAERRLQLLGFVDAGHVMLHKHVWPNSVVNADNANSYSLAGAGIGANLWVGRWTVRAAVARTLGDNPGRSLAGRDADSRSSNWRAWVQAAFAF